MAMCECNSQSYTFLFRDPFVNIFSGNRQWDTSKHNEAYSDKGSILRGKLQRIFLRNFLVMCEFISQSYIYVSWGSPFTLSLRYLRKASFDRI